MVYGLVVRGPFSDYDVRFGQSIGCVQIHTVQINPGTMISEK